MKITKQEFKNQYSEYRKHLKSQLFNYNRYSLALNSNPLYRSCFIKHDFPVSVKIWCFLNKK